MLNQNTKCIQILRNISEEVTTILTFTLAYLTHASHYNMFPHLRELMDIRFILDCYHVTIFETTGILVSDYYIHIHIEKIFYNRFFFYKQEGALKLTRVDPQKGMQFFKHYSQSKEEMDKLLKSQSFSDDDRLQVSQLFTTLNRNFNGFRQFRHSKVYLQANRMSALLA